MFNKLEGELRKSGDPADKTRAAILKAMLEERGKDVPIPAVERETEIKRFSHEGKNIHRWSLETGGHRTVAELETALKKAKIRVSDWAADMMRTPEFAASLQREPETFDLVMLSVSDLGFSEIATTRQIFDRANDLGLALCDPRIGPYQRLADRNQKMDDVYWIGMDPITDSDGRPFVFGLRRYEDGAWLHGLWAPPDDGWGPRYRVVFSLRK